LCVRKSVILTPIIIMMQAQSGTVFLLPIFMLLIFYIYNFIKLYHFAELYKVW